MTPDDIAAWQIDDTLEWTELYGEVPDPPPGWTIQPTPIEDCYSLRLAGQSVGAIVGFDAARDYLRRVSCPEIEDRARGLSDALIGHGFGPDFEGGEA